MFLDVYNYAGFKYTFWMGKIKGDLFYWMAYLVIGTTIVTLYLYQKVLLF